jgi:hypothetical protein
VEDAYPLTALQAGLLFHADLDVAAGFYHDVITYALEIPFDEAALRASAGEIVSRHPILRTSFDLTSFEAPVQCVHRHAEVPLRVVDLRGLSAADRDAALADFVRSARREAFDPTQAPLLRLHVHRLDEERFQVALDFHHAILDGWSEAALITELVNRYDAHRSGRALAREPWRAAYRDYVALEREALRSADQRAFWERSLVDAEPTQLPRSPRVDVTGTEHAHAFWEELPPPLCASLATAARQAEVPLKSLLLAAHLKAPQRADGDA